MRGSNEKMTRSSSVVTRHDRRGSCVVMTADGPASSPTAAKVCNNTILLHFGCTTAPDAADTIEVVVIYCMSKMEHYSCEFAKYSPIFEVLSPTDIT